MADTPPPGPPGSHSPAGAPVSAGGREALVAEHLELAAKLTATLLAQHRIGGSWDDLLAYARGGLVEAAERFDPARGIPFHQFARYRILGALYDGVRQMGWQVRDRRQQRFAVGANAYLEEVAGERPRGAPLIARTLEERTGSLAVIYLTALDGSGDPAEPADERSGALRTMERLQLAIGLQRSLARLPPRERRLLEGMYYEGRTLTELAAELGLGLPWASRLHRRAVESLRTLLREGGLLT